MHHKEVQARLEAELEQRRVQDIQEENARVSAAVSLRVEWNPFVVHPTQVREVARLNDPSALDTMYRVLTATNDLAAEVPQGPCVSCERCEGPLDLDTGACERHHECVQEYARRTRSVLTAGHQRPQSGSSQHGRGQRGARQLLPW